MSGTDDSETVRIDGLTVFMCGRLLSAAKAVYGGDSDEWRAVQGTHVVADRATVQRLEAAARRLAVREFDTTLYRAAERLDGGL